MKIALITDIHIFGRNNSEIFSNYFLGFFENTFFPFLVENEIKDIICLGDMFDTRKHANFKIYKQWRDEFFPRLNEYNVTLILGNHDVFHRESLEINSPSLLLSEYNNIRIIDSPKKEGNFLFLPWIIKENEEETIKLIESSKAQYVFGHLELNGFLHEGIVSEKGLDPAIFKKFKHVFSGHYHSKSSKGNISYLGSPYQITFGDYGQERGFHIFDTDTGEIEFKENPSSLFEKIYSEQISSEFDFSSLKGKYVKLIVEENISSVRLEKLVGTIHESNPINLEIIEKSNEIGMEEIEALDETKDTLTVLLEYASQIEGELDRNLLLSILKETYESAVIKMEGI